MNQRIAKCREGRNRAGGKRFVSPSVSWKGLGFCVCLILFVMTGCYKSPQQTRDPEDAKQVQQNARPAGNSKGEGKRLRRQVASKVTSSDTPVNTPAMEAPATTASPAPAHPLEEDKADNGTRGRFRRASQRPARRTVRNGVDHGPEVADAVEKKEGGKNKKKTAQVWQRSETNTVLSRVSVGGGNYLILKKMRVTVYVQGLRARTVIDHIYHNPYDRVLQGTFKYTLPSESSISYYAMFVGQQQRQTPRFFVGKGPSPRQLIAMQPQQMASLSPVQTWGRLREARLVAAEKGREVYEEITRRRIDPALLEQDAPNTFQGRVFPIPAKGYNRVILAYEQTLPALEGEQVYRFRFPQEVAESIDFSLEYNDALSRLERSNLRKIRCRTKPNRSFLQCYWEQNKPDRDAVFYFKPQQPNISWVTGADPVDQQQYLYTRVNLDFPASDRVYASSQAVFMLDTSLSANPDTFAAHVKLLHEILVRNEKTLQRFNVLLFDVGAQWASAQGWIKNTASERKSLFAKLHTIVLEGATNLDTTFKTLARPAWEPGQHESVDMFFLSDGQLNWGETQIEAIVSSFRQKSIWKNPRFFAYQLGIGAENLAILQRLAREGGAVFTCLGQSSLQQCATAHTKPAMFLEQVKIEGIEASDILVAGRQTSIFPGGSIVLAARYGKVGKATLALRGQVQGKPLTLTYTIPVETRGDLAPRAWAELAVQQLSELDDPKLTNLIVAYSQHFRIPNKHCSFLVLETDAEYKQYGLEDWKKTEKVADVASFIAGWIQKRGVLRSLRERWMATLRKGMERANMLQQSSGRAVFSLLQQLHEQEFALGDVVAQKLWTKHNVPRAYVQTRLKDRNVFDAFTKEAKRRLREDVGGAVRALSCIVELHPSNPQALRLVGYYLMSWKRSSEAARIFLRVLEQRSFEPHSYRDLARALIKRGQFALASALYEILLAGTWDDRFGRIKTVAREEYAMLVRQALQHSDIQPSIKSVLRERQALLGLHVQPSKLRVTVTWNTDNTDIDLWVIEPNGEKCFYSHRQTSNQGQLLDDITRGYGPERYQNVGTRSGKYDVKLHFYGHSSNVLGNETHASVLIVVHAGTPEERVIEKNLVLKRRASVVSVTTLQL